MTKVNCPKCDFEIVIPDDCKKGRGKCPSCMKELSVEELLSQNGKVENNVLEWIADAKPSDPNSIPVENEPSQTIEVKEEPKPSPIPEKNEDVIMAEPVFVPGDKNFDIKLDHVDEMGAFFLFSDALLYDADFRSCAPQKCILCGGNEDLSIHLINWPIKLNGTRANTSNVNHSPCVYKLSKFKGMSTREILEKIPPIEHQPEPWCFPFPYFVCGNCSPVGALFTDVQPEKHICELGFSSLKRAYDFAKTVCGEDCSVTRAIMQAIKDNAHCQAWRQLPLAVRNKINKWFQSHDGEKFICYISDADFSKAEAGLAGIVITDKRMVYHKSLSQAQFDLHEPITIEKSESDNGKLKLSFSSKTASVKGFTATETILRQIMQFINDANHKTLSV